MFYVQKDKAPPMYCSYTQNSKLMSRADYYSHTGQGAELHYDSP